MSSPKSSNSNKRHGKSRAKASHPQKRVFSNTLPISPRLKVSVSSETHRVNVLKEEKEAQYQELQKRRPRSPLSPLRTWIHKSSKHSKKSKSHKPKPRSSSPQATQSTTRSRRPRSHSNCFFDAPPPKYRKPWSDDTRPRTQTPKNTQSKYKKKRMSNPVDPHKQLKFTKRNDKIIIETHKTQRKKKKKKKKQSFVSRASRKLSHHIVSNESTTTTERSKSFKPVKRGSFFSINRDKTRSKSKPKKKHKSFKQKILTARRMKQDTDDNEKQHEKRSSLQMHKMRMIRAVQEAISEDDDASDVAVVRLKHQLDVGHHHKRGSSGIPSFFEASVQFELRQYLDEKARLFIAFCMRMYGLRCSEEVFEIISRFHVMPFDSGFICITNDAISYHFPLLQLPAVATASSMPTVLDAIHDDRLDLSPHSMPLPYSRSYDQNTKTKKLAMIDKARSAEYNAQYRFGFGLSQSESVHTPTVGDGFCDVKTKEDVIKKYKNKVHKKRRKDAQRKKKFHGIKRAESLDRDRVDTKNSNLQIHNDQLFYNSAPELADDDDFFVQETDGFPDINYEELLQFNGGRTTLRLDEREISDSKSNTMTGTQTTSSFNKMGELDGYCGELDESYTETMTPRTPTIPDSNNHFFGNEFQLSFDVEERQVNEWHARAVTNGDNGVGIAEWTLLSTPAVFDSARSDALHTRGQLGIGGFIDRTRGVCGVSLAPIYYEYGGIVDAMYYNKLDVYNLYTGDYMTCCDALPFSDLYDTASSIVRTGYESTLVISGGQVYGNEIFDDNMIQNKTFLYAPWMKSAYHQSISCHDNVKSSRRNSIESNHRLSLNFDNIMTRPTSRSISHINGASSPAYKSKRVSNVRSKTNDWLCGPQMLKARASHGSVAWDEHIVFCCGGFGASGRRIGDVEMLRMDKLNCAEDLSKLRWRKCQSMSANKSNLVLIHWKPKTCIVSVGAGSKVVESYDPYKNAWKDLPPLNTTQISNKSCRFYYDDNCLMFLKWTNGTIKAIEYLDERVKVKRWTNLNQHCLDVFNAQFVNKKLKNIKPFCFA